MFIQGTELREPGGWGGEGAEPRKALVIWGGGVEARQEELAQGVHSVRSEEMGTFQLEESELDCGGAVSTRATSKGKRQSNDNYIFFS